MKKYIFILVVFFGLKAANAQVSYVHLSFSSTGALYNDTVNEGDFLTVSCWVKNTGNIALSSPIDMYVSSMDDSSNMILANQYVGSYNTNNDTLYPGDSIHVVTTNYVSLQAFKAGDNIVVIWPNAIGNSPITIDELVLSVHVNTINEIENKLTSDLIIFNNPLDNNILVKADREIDSYRLINILGNSVCYEQGIKESSISIQKGKLKSGVYFIEVRQKDIVQLRKIIIN